MPDFNDNELDKLFQEAADQIRPEFDAQDWEQLSARLDQHDDKGILYRSASLYGIVILLLIFNVRNLWKEYYGAASASNILAKEISHRINNSTNSKHVNANSIKSYAKNSVVIENDSINVESKNSVSPLQESARLNKTESKPDVSKVSPTQKFRSKESHSQIETIKENNRDIQKDNKHNILHAPNETRSDIEVVENSGDIDRNSVHENSRDINKDNERSSLDNNKQNASIKHSALVFDKNDNAQTFESNKNKETDALDTDKRSEDVMHSKAASDMKDDTQISELNKKQDGSSLDNTDKQSVDVSNAGLKLLKEDSTEVNDLNKDANKQSRRDFIHVEVVPNRNDSTRAYDLNEDKKVDALHIDKQDMNVVNSEIVSNDNGKQTSDLNKEKETNALLNNDKQRVTNKHADIAGNKSDSTLISDSTKIQEDKHTQLVDVSSEDSSDVQTESVKTRTLFVKLPISPDFSSVKNESIGGPGINAGLLVEYNINKHIAFETGAIWSKKIYDAHYATVNFVEGDCRILDIPINIKYYLLPDSRLNFFASVGFSSYVMLKEKYDYTVVTPNNGERHWSQEFSKKNNEWFSMLNLSVGIQRQMGKRLWLQGEPFFKAPIAGVGVGNIKLASMGAFLTLKYKIK